ncbi:MAG: HD domain-containing protein [bacterium]|nr:HD domain-containing protein [bacterium]
MLKVSRFLADYLIHRPRQRLQSKIILSTIMVVAVWISISTYISLLMQTGYFVEGAKKRILEIAQTLETSINHSMLIGKHEDVKDLLNNIANEVDMEDVRIIDDQKKIIASGDINEVGTVLDKVDLSFINQGKNELIELTPDYTSISILKPIIGKSNCYACHSNEDKFMGILQVRISIAWMRVPLMESRFFIILSAVVTLFLIGISIYFLLSKLVAKPIHSLMEVMNIVRRGNWDARVLLNTTDELGKLGNTFNYMISEISELHERDLRREQALVRAEEELKYKRQIEEKNIQLERTIDILTTLNNIAKEIGSVADLDQLLSSVLKMTTNILNGASGYLSIFDRDLNQLKVSHILRSGLNPGEDLLNQKIAQHVFDTGKSVLIPHFSQDGRFHIEEIKNHMPRSVLYVPLYTKDRIMGVIGMIDKQSNTPFTLDDFELLTTIASEAAVAVENFNLYNDLKKSYFDTIRALVNAIEAKDPYTYGHSERVTELSLLIARELGLPEKSLEILRHASILHDVGKIGVSLNILHKEMTLSPDEVAMVREHSLIGSKIIDHISFLKEVREGIKHHHERYDGRGYPDGLGPSQVSIETRILAVADAFDAMTSDRPYRQAQRPEEALQELRRCAGTQFDPAIVNVFIRVWKKVSKLSGSLKDVPDEDCTNRAKIEIESQQNFE